MAIQFLIRAWWLPMVLLFVGCEKWADGVVTDIEFPEHTSSLAASGIFINGDTKAILSVNSTSGLQSPLPIALPEGATATLALDGQAVLSWGVEDASMVGESFQAIEMLVLEMENPLNLTPGDYELKVSAPGEELLTANAILPPAPVFSYEFEPLADSLMDYWGVVVYDELRVSLVNRPGKRDVYGLRFEEGVVNTSDTTWVSVFGKDIEDPRIAYSSACQCWLVDDENTDGQLLDDIYLSREWWAESYYGFDPANYPLRLIVDHMGPSLGDFYRSVDTHEEANDNFFANPSGIYSNTSTGFGHLGLVNRKTVAVN